jgi:peroxiredoxin family protein
MMSASLAAADPGSVETRLDALEAEVKSLREQLEKQRTEDSLSIICFSGEWDRLFAAFTIAAGALAMGMEVHLFFTFWALNALRASGKVKHEDTSFLQAMFKRMMPQGLEQAPLSKFNFGGLGKAMVRRVMKKEGVDDIDVLFDELKDLGVCLHICETTTSLFGLQCQELDVDEGTGQCGVTTFLGQALDSRMVLFI